MARLSDSITYGNHDITGDMYVGNKTTVNGIEVSPITITGGSNVTVSGSYPNFTISKTDTNTNTTYSAGTGLSLSGTTFSLSDQRFTTTLLNKLNGIESSADVNYTKSEIDALAINAGTIDSINSTQFVRSDANDTVSGVLTFTNGNPIDTKRGISGSYNDNAGTGGGWGASIWGMGDAYAGSGYGNSYTMGGYNLGWLRGSHSQANSNVAEGVYINSQNDYVGGIGTGGGNFAKGITTTTITNSNGLLGSNSTRQLFIAETVPSPADGEDGDVWYRYGDIPEVVEPDPEPDPTPSVEFSATYVTNKNISGNLTNAGKIRFKPDGTKMFVAERFNEGINEYSLSTPWNVSTAAFVSSTSFNINSGSTNKLQSFIFKPDGLAVLILYDNTVYQYTLSTAWDMSTAAYNTFNQNSLYTSVATGEVSDIHINSQGTKLYVLKSISSTYRIYQYSISTPWFINGIMYDSKNVTLAGGNNQAMLFYNNGKTVFVLNSANKQMVRYNLSTAFDISTASNANQIFTLTNGVVLYGIAMSFDQTKLYTTDVNTRIAYQYNITQL